MQSESRMLNFRISDSDDELLKRISRHFSDATFSAILRRLIREEAARLGIEVVDVSMAEEALQEPA